MINVNKLYWGRKCKVNPDHNSDQGTLRVHGFGCAMCQDRWKDMTADQITHWFHHEQKIPDTPEQRRLKQIELSKSYQRRNPDRVKDYHQEYEQREETKQRRRQHYKNMDPVKKAEYLKKQAEYNKKWRLRQEEMQK